MVLKIVFYCNNLNTLSRATSYDAPEVKVKLRHLMSVSLLKYLSDLLLEIIMLFYLSDKHHKHVDY